MSVSQLISSMFNQNSVIQPTSSAVERDRVTATVSPHGELNMIMERTREHWKETPNPTMDSEYAEKKGKRRSKFGKNLGIRVDNVSEDDKT